MARGDDSTAPPPVVAVTPPPAPSAAPEDRAARDLAASDALADDADAPLLAAARRGDSAAFGRLVERHQGRLYNALVRFTGSAEDAQDIAQETFIQAYSKLAGFQGNCAFYTWIYRIAFNRAVSHGRKRRPRASLDVLREAGGVEPVASGPTPEVNMLAEERVALVQRAISELAADHRQVVVLREIEGFDYQQIADVLEVPIGTVRSRLFRARMQIKERLAPLLAEPLGG